MSDEHDASYWNGPALIILRRLDLVLLLQAAAQAINAGLLPPHMAGRAREICRCGFSSLSEELPSDVQDELADLLNPNGKE